LVLISNDVTEDVVVAKGELRFHPNDPNLRLDLPLDAVQLRQMLRGSGGRETFLEALSGATGFTVIDEAKGLGLLEWRSEDQAVPDPELPRVSADGLDTLLKAIAEQTGLTFTIEPRKITRRHVAIKK
jgi:hypothetical protein